MFKRNLDESNMVRYRVDRIQNQTKYVRRYQRFVVIKGVDFSVFIEF